MPAIVEFGESSKHVSYVYKNFLQRMTIVLEQNELQRKSLYLSHLLHYKLLDTNEAHLGYLQEICTNFKSQRVICWEATAGSYFRRRFEKCFLDYSG